jgi:hypothetical protein
VSTLVGVTYPIGLGAKKADVDHRC